MRNIQFLVFLFVGMFSGLSSFGQQPVGGYFRFDKQFVIIAKNSEALPLKELVKSFLIFNDIRELDTRHLSSDEERNGVDTIFLSFERKLPHNNYYYNISRHSVELTYGAGLTHYDMLGVFRGAFKTRKFRRPATLKKVSVKVLDASKVAKGHSNLASVEIAKTSVDMTNNRGALSDIEEDLLNAINLKNHSIEIVVYSGEGGFSVGSEVLMLYRPGAVYGKGSVVEMKKLMSRLAPYKDKLSLVFVFDFTKNSSSYFKELFGYESLSVEGKRVLSSYISTIEPLLRLGSVSIRHRSSGLVYECYLKPHTDYLKENKINVEERFSK